MSPLTSAFNSLFLSCTPWSKRSEKATNTTQPTLAVVAQQCMVEINQAPHLLPSDRTAIADMLDILLERGYLRIPENDTERHRAVAGLQFAMERVMQGTEYMVVPDVPTPLRTGGDSRQPQAQQVRRNALLGRLEQGQPLQIICCEEALSATPADGFYQNNVRNRFGMGDSPLLVERSVAVTKAHFAPGLSGAFILDPAGNMFAIRANQKDAGAGAAAGKGLPSIDLYLDEVELPPDHTVVSDARRRPGTAQSMLQGWHDFMVQHQMPGLLAMPKDLPARRTVQAARLLPSQMHMAQQQYGSHPELSWLAASNVAVTNDGIAQADQAAQTYSQALHFDEKFNELERSLYSLRALHLLASASPEDYLECVEYQKSRVAPDAVLTFTQFQMPRGYMLKTAKALGMSHAQVRDAAEVALVLGDLGKSESARAHMAQFGIVDQDHDDFYAHVMRNKAARESLPSFMALDEKQQRLLIDSAGLAHFGHITHCEGGADMFDRLVALGTDRAALIEFALLVQYCDVAGAQAHRDIHGSVTLTSDTWRALSLTREAALRAVSHGSIEAYRYYLEKRAEWLGLDPALPAEVRLTLSAIGAMLRLFDSKSGQGLLDGFNRLDHEVQRDVLRWLNPLEAHKPYDREPTYIPAVLNNLLNASSELPQQERVAVTVESGFAFIVRGLRQYETLLDQGAVDRGTPLNLNDAAGYARRGPDAMRRAEVVIDTSTLALSARQAS